MVRPCATISWWNVSYQEPVWCNISAISYLYPSTTSPNSSRPAGTCFVWFVTRIARALAHVEALESFPPSFMFFDLKCLKRMLVDVGSWSWHPRCCTQLHLPKAHHLEYMLAIVCPCGQWPTPSKALFMHHSFHCTFSSQSRVRIQINTPNHKHIQDSIMNHHTDPNLSRLLSSEFTSQVGPAWQGVKKRWQSCPLVGKQKYSWKQRCERLRFTGFQFPTFWL